ncbi:MAG: hypothetical protein AB2747_07865 [Candidatus Thiodiazotropha taylori]
MLEKRIIETIKEILTCSGISFQEGSERFQIKDELELLLAYKLHSNADQCLPSDNSFPVALLSVVNPDGSVDKLIEINTDNLYSTTDSACACDLEVVFEASFSPDKSGLYSIQIESMVYDIELSLHKVLRVNLAASLRVFSKMGLVLDNYYRAPYNTGMRYIVDTYYFYKP